MNLDGHPAVVHIAYIIGDKGLIRRWWNTAVLDNRSRLWKQSLYVGLLSNLAHVLWSSSTFVTFHSPVTNCSMLWRAGTLMPASEHDTASKYAPEHQYNFLLETLTVRHKRALGLPAWRSAIWANGSFNWTPWALITVRFTVLYRKLYYLAISITYYQYHYCTVSYQPPG